MRAADRFLNSLTERAMMLRTPSGRVQVACDGDGPAVLVSHGGPGGFDQGLMYGRHLRDRGCKLIAPSRPGYLRTPMDSGRSPVEQADLMASVLDELGIDRAVMLGYSSGGPAAVNFAARHPDRVRALLLDSAVTMPFETPGSVLERAFVFSSFGAWWLSQVAERWPQLASRTFVDGFSVDLDKQRKRAAVDWITSDESRQALVQELWLSFGPWDRRQHGFRNDEINESDLDPLPFAEIACPTLIAHGSNDGAVPIGHARHACAQISGADLIVVPDGHHLLPASPGFDVVLERQVALTVGKTQ